MGKESERKMIVHTATGSIYEFDTENKRVRRLHGKSDPTAHQGKDTEWKEYASANLLEDNSVLIIWGLKDGVAQTTRTSCIVKTDVDGTKAN